MRGIIAEAHFDHGRNFVAMLKVRPALPSRAQPSRYAARLIQPTASQGKKRYILLPPESCKDVYMYPRSHPEGRHSSVDWSNPEVIAAEKYPHFKDARALEEVLVEGEVLYIPHMWIHYIVSLETNVQCNARSGNSMKGMLEAKECGF